MSDTEHDPFIASYQRASPADRKRMIDTLDTQPHSPHTERTRLESILKEEHDQELKYHAEVKLFGENRPSDTLAGGEAGSQANTEFAEAKSAGQPSKPIEIVNENRDLELVNLEGHLAGYRVHELLGRGGMGKVFLATQLSLKRKVVIKVLHAFFGQNQVMLERFKLEARAQAGMSHPNLVQVYEIGESDKLNYMVMEYIPGTNLRNYIYQDTDKDKAKIDLAERMSIFHQILDGLEHAHHNKFIHRDLKPANIFLTPKKVAKIGDFGLVKSLVEEGMTMVGSVMGTPAYMAPEQAMGFTATAQSDLYSLGIILYELLTGELPQGTTEFTGSNQSMMKISFPDMRQVNPRVPDHLAYLFHLLTQADSKARPHTCAEVRSQLNSEYVPLLFRYGSIQNFIWRNLKNFSLILALGFGILLAARNLVMGSRYSEWIKPLVFAALSSPLPSGTPYAPATNLIKVGETILGGAFHLAEISEIADSKGHGETLLEGPPYLVFTITSPEGRVATGKPGEPLQLPPGKYHLDFPNLPFDYGFDLSLSPGKRYRYQCEPWGEVCFANLNSHAVSVADSEGRRHLTRQRRLRLPPGDYHVTRLGPNSPEPRKITLRPGDEPVRVEF